MDGRSSKLKRAKFIVLNGITIYRVSRYFFDDMYRGRNFEHRPSVLCTHSDADTAAAESR